VPRDSHAGRSFSVFLNLTLTINPWRSQDCGLSSSYLSSQRCSGAREAEAALELVIEALERLPNLGELSQCFVLCFRGPQAEHLNHPSFWAATNTL